MKRVIRAFIAILIILSVSFPVEVYADSNTVDVTNLVRGDLVNHVCSDYLIVKYDSSKHWNECSLCGKKYNEASHSLVDAGWTGGSANICAVSNVHKYTCICGYSTSNTTGKKAHTFTGASISYGGYCRYQHCTSCNQNIVDHYCYDSNNKRINCENLKKCAICGHDYFANKDSCCHNSVMYAEKSISSSRIFMDSTHKSGTYNVMCFQCGRYLGTATFNVTNLNTSNGQLTATATFNPSGCTINKCVTQFGTSSSSSAAFSTITSASSSSDKKTISASTSWNAHCEGRLENLQLVWRCSCDDGLNNATLVTAKICSEYIPPTINTPTLTDVKTKNGWTTQKKITITGTENYCNTVNIQVLDDKNKVIASGSASVTPTNNGTSSSNSRTYTWSCQPPMEAGASGKTYTIKVTDGNDNVATKTFSVSKVDSVPPVSASPTASAKTWSKTKPLTAKASDTGSGTVSIGFNATRECGPSAQSGSNYTRDYILTGDVTGDNQAILYYLDDVGNTSSSYYTFSNLDNTAPTISSAAETAKGDGTIKFVTNDYCEAIGKNGSGQVADGAGNYGMYYGYSTTDDASKATWSELKQSTTYTTPELPDGDYYLFVKDYVGNVSESTKVTLHNTYTITYGFKGGKFSISYTPPYKYTVKNGAKVEDDIERKGYNFAGWQKVE